MYNKKHQLYYNTPLNISQTIDLPSNLLKSKYDYKLGKSVALTKAENI